jgi:UDP-GlcNAc:undecaprenyl-phosphate/decaprenyl-phosphate GlcNAc-1-phosphate transferase
VEAAFALAALPVTFAVLWALLRTGAGTRLVAHPSGERWREQPTPMFGGVGIFAGFIAASGLALASGALEWSGELGGILGGCTLLFLAGLIDDLRHLSALIKLALQIGAAVLALASGLQVEIVGNDVLAWAIGLLWLVGITNAFNLLDNMDGLAATLAAIACGYFAIDGATEHPNDTVLVLSLSLGLACVGFLPFNLRPGRAAHVWMGDSGSQVLGFALACFALASSWTVAGTTVATVLLPLLILAIPILDTTLVTLVRLAQRRPVHHGGRDHTSHRLVYYGLSEAKAVLLLALVAGALGATALAYNVLDNSRLTAFGVLVTFVLLVQFGSFLSDLEERSRRGAEVPEPPLWRALVFEPRRLVEVVADFLVICISLFTAYVLVIGSLGSEFERSIFLATLPILLGIRYVAFVSLGVYRRVWRFATARDVVPIAVACMVSAAITYFVLLALRDLGSFPALEVLVVDALLCTLLVGASRLALRLVPETRSLARDRRRVLLVGAGRAGRGLARELHDAHDSRVVGFLDDNPRVRRRRILGITVLGSLDEATRAIAGARADEVLVTIPDADPGRLEHVVRAADEAGVPCRIVRRRTEFSTPEPVKAALP